MGKQDLKDHTSFTTWFTEYLQNILSLQLKAIALKIE